MNILTHRAQASTIRPDPSLERVPRGRRRAGRSLTSWSYACRWLRRRRSVLLSGKTTNHTNDTNQIQNVLCPLLPIRVIRGYLW